MTDLQPAPVVTSATPTASSTDRATRGRRGSRPLAALTALAPLTVPVAVLLHPDDTGGAKATLDALAGDERALWAATHLLEPLAWLGLGTALLLALPRLAPGRGRRLVTIGAPLAFVGYVCIAFIVYGHGEAFLHMSADGVDRTAMGPLFDIYEDGMPLAALPSLLSRLGVVVAAVGLIRARTIPLWAPLLLLASPFTFSAGATDLPLLVSIPLAFAPLVAPLALIARKVAVEGGPALGGA